MGTFALTTLGSDRPGVVACIAEVLARYDVNITDSEMSILRGHFVMMLIITIPAEAEITQLRTDLESAGSEVGLEYVLLNEISEQPQENALTPSFSISVYGADHPGILSLITRALADAGVSICDLKTRIVGEGADKPLYVVLMEVSATEHSRVELDRETLEEILTQPAKKAGVDVSVQEIETSVL